MNPGCRQIDKAGVSQNLNELSLLLNISNRFSETPDLKKALRMILPLMAVHTDMSCGTMLFLKKSTDEILIEEGYGLPDEMHMNVRYRPGEGIMGMVIDTGHPAVILGTSEKSLSLDKNDSRHTFAKEEISFIGMPVKTGKKVMGALVVDRLFDNPMSIEEDLRLLKSVASIIAKEVHIRELAEEEQERLLEENRRLKDELRVKHAPGKIIGLSKAIQNISNYINTVSGTNTNVLIFGEGGVGKERIAKTIHCQSSRSKQAFIKVVCDNLPESLIESEMFGYEKGAVFGTPGWRKGSLDIADGGTLFLEEVGALTPILQAKLLRVLKEGKFERYGGNKPVSVDVRIIAGTNDNLEARMREGKFSEDLYYQLNVFPIIVPPLRERSQDIVLLTDFFIERYVKEVGKNITAISPSAMDLLMNYSWPGNVQELKGYIERAVILSTDGIIHHYHLPPSLQLFKGHKRSRKTAVGSPDVK